jgi:hypothetical protein
MTLFELKDGLCGETKLNKNDWENSNELAHLEEGNCSSIGYSVPNGTKELQVPAIKE